MTEIERLARIVSDKLGGNYHGDTFEDAEYRQHCEDIVRALLTAMREPTDVTLDVGVPFLSAPNGNTFVSRCELRDAFRAMIDHILCIDGSKAVVAPVGGSATVTAVSGGHVNTTGVLEEM